MPDFELMHQSVRVALVIGGGAGAIHYWLMCNFVTKAPNWVKLAALAPAVGTSVTMAMAGLFDQIYVGLIAALLAFCSVVAVNVAAWYAGAYISDVLAKQHDLKQARKQAYNRYRADLMTPWESVSDLVTPSGWEEISESEKRSKERA